MIYNLPEPILASFFFEPLFPDVDQLSLQPGRTLPLTWVHLPFFALR